MSVFTKAKTVNKVCLVPLDWIHPNPGQPRKTFPDAELQSLADSISANGLLQPITLRKAGNTLYYIIAGERRYMACQRLGMRNIPSIICDVTSDDAAVLALIENIQRSDLNFMEEAFAIQTLIQQLNITQEQAARRLGKSQSAVANKLRLLRLPESVQNSLIGAGLTERHARAILRLPQDQMEEAAAYIVSSSLNVAETESFVNEILVQNQSGQGDGRSVDLTKSSPLTKSSEDRLTAGKRGKKLLVVKDLRIFTNTISRAIETMKQAGIEAVSQTKEEDTFIEYVVRIPKEFAYRQKSTS